MNSLTRRCSGAFRSNKWCRRLLLVMVCGFPLWFLNACEDSPLEPAPGPQRPDFQKGMSFACWFEGCLDRDVARQALAEIAATGSNWVAVVPTWYQPRLDSDEIASHPSLSPSDHEIRVTLRRARSSGYRVMLKPHVDVLTGQWRGKIKPTDPDRWFGSYREFVLHYARMAEDEGAQQFVLGTEMASLTDEEARWRSLIRDARGQFSGTLTYAANWDEFERVPFWDALDVVGIDAFFPLTNNPRATVTEMMVGWQFWIDRLRKWQAGIGKEILFTELGYTSQDGSNTRPYDFRISERVDLQEQADAYRAALYTLRDQSWLGGIFWWVWNPDRSGGSDDLGYTPFGKPAAAELAAAWRFRRDLSLTE